MTKPIHRLHPLKIKNLSPGSHPDGGGLILRVRNENSRSWIFRYSKNGKPAEIGLGPARDVSLGVARQLATEMRLTIINGGSPKQVIELKCTQATSEPETDEKTFEQYAVEYINHKKSGWRNNKHAAQWTSTLNNYAIPFIGKKAISRITVDSIKQILAPIWKSKTETASRVRQRVEAVLDYAYLHEKIEKSNPARWKGCLELIFPAPKKVTPVTHFHALAYTDLPNIMQTLRDKDAFSAYCLRWIALTACRSSEARGMTWQEIDMINRVWVIPRDRMKAHREHRVPLNDECMEILERLLEYKSYDTDRVFYLKLSDVSVSKMLKSVSKPEATVHGLRSSFRDWCGDTTDFPREVCEAALAHIVANQTEAAYRRSDLLEKRRSLMNQWGDYLSPPV